MSHFPPMHSVTPMMVMPGVDERLSRDDLYMNIAKQFALRSTCQRGHVGCVAVLDNHIVAAGYNGAPPGMPHCLDVGCATRENPVEIAKRAILGDLMAEDQRWRYEQAYERVSRFMEPHFQWEQGCTRAVHAEMNMVAFAGRHGIALGGCTVYATHGPCLPCAQALVSAGIAKLVYETPYRLLQGLELVDQANVEIEQYGRDA